MARTLCNLSDLRETKYGQPPPRHGLNLLWWFAHDCVQTDFNGRMTAQCNPANGAFGFHRFHNWDGLLPKINLPYYEVGNLNTTDSLPDYVTKSYTGHSDSSNTDRIIVSFDSMWRRFENVYVTQHSDQVHFDQNRTYCISTDLMKNIKALSREDFLRESMNLSERVSIDIHQSAQRKNQRISNELMKHIKVLNREDFPSKPMNHSEHVSIDVHQSVQRKTCQSVMEDNKESSCEDVLIELIDNNEHFSMDKPQSGKIGSLQSQSTCAECCTMLSCALCIVIIIATIVWHFKQ